MRLMETITELEKFAPRQASQEAEARKYIEARLTKIGIEFECSEFDNYLPWFRACWLEADGQKIGAMPTAFRSGNIEGKPLISSMAVSGRYYEQQNINFNPYSDTFSLATFYRAPSLAILRNDVPEVLKAEQVNGAVSVSKRKHRCANIIAGNNRNPRNVLICHYDSVLGGALDNASGVATLLEIAEMGRAKDSMIVFSGCEELSFDSPVYWGKGYRELERAYAKQIKLAKRLIVVDMLGSGSPGEVLDKNTRLAAFPVENKEVSKRAKIISVKGTEWFPIYHSRSDTPELIKPNHLKEGLEMVLANML